jgi:hypothetical protein
VFSPFVVDATVTLARRVARGERIWVAHRSHAYQRLILSGWSPRRLAAGAYLLMIAAAATALALRAEEASVQWVILGLWCALYVAVFAAIEWRGASVSRP